ncbi:hypothetical protein I3843_07G113200 [Carya illinoinensis]|uniref:Uncharacterized protein n=1 Tax=Carya illinoinensis TaxID=32201 RepID=A0A922EJI0_CARIL|nr:hypothetical protein I3842_07G117800 [Carya illinoinensis]KAG7970995.1 hypothetical protein I3843_07G113200 [Carya illinoinensis]
MSQCGTFASFYQFTQQKLPGCKPVQTPAWVTSQILLFTSDFHNLLFVLICVLVVLRISHAGHLYISIDLVTLHSYRPCYVLFMLPKVHAFFVVTFKLIMLLPACFFVPSQVQ